LGVVVVVVMYTRLFIQNKILNKTISNLSFEKECIEKSIDAIHTRIETLRIEKKEL